MALSATCLFASLNDVVKPWLRLQPSDVEHDVVLEQLANSITEELERLSHRVYVTRAITETFSSAGARRFTLRGYPVTSPLTTFTIDGTAVATDEYTLDTARGIVTLIGGARSSSTGTDNVVITYTAGYARASVPVSVSQLAAEMVALRYQDWSAGANAAQSMRMGGSEYIPRSSWPYQIKDAIDALRVEVRGATIA